MTTLEDRLAEALREAEVYTIAIMGYVEPGEEIDASSERLLERIGAVLAQFNASREPLLAEREAQLERVKALPGKWRGGSTMDDWHYPRRQCADELEAILAPVVPT